MVGKLGGIVFLWVATWKITIRLLRGRTWNSITVNLEEKRGRSVLTYVRRTGEFILYEWPNRESE